MEQRFSQSGQRALVWAYQAAKRLGHGAIGPEHLLLGALHEEDGRLAQLAEQQLTPESAAGEGPSSLTPQGAAAIEQAAALASPHGIITARWKPIYQLIQLPMNIIKATPVASFVILALIWISGKNLSVFIAFLMVLPMVWSSVDQGLKSADPQLLEAAKTYRLSRLQTARAVYVPAVLPYLLSVSRVAVGFAWKSGIAGEVIAIPKDSIGTQLYDAKVYLETTDLFAWTVVIVLAV